MQVVFRIARRKWVPECIRPLVGHFNLNFPQKFPYIYTVEVFWSDEDKGFIAFVHVLEGCSAWGETREAALREVETAIGLWLEAAKEMGRQVPLPNPPALSFH